MIRTKEQSVIVLDLKQWFLDGWLTYYRFRDYDLGIAAKVSGNVFRGLLLW